MSQTRTSRTRRPAIKRVPQNTRWLMAMVRDWFGDELTVAQITENGRFPVVYFWQTYAPGGGDDDVDMTTFNGVLSEAQFQREFSKAKRHLHFPSVCEIDTRKREDWAPENARAAPV